MLLLDVDGERQEVDVTQATGCRGAEHHRLAGLDYDSSARLAGQLPGLEGDLFVANLQRDATYVKHAQFILFSRAARSTAPRFI